MPHRLTMPVLTADPLVSFPFLAGALEFRQALYVPPTHKACDLLDFFRRLWESCGLCKTTETHKELKCQKAHRSQPVQAKPISTSHPASWPTARGLHHLAPSGNGHQLLVSLGLCFYTDLCCDSFTKSRNTAGNESSLRTDRPSCQASNSTPHNHQGGRELLITHHSRGRYGTAGACQRPHSLAGLDTAAEATAPAALLGTALQSPEHTAAGRGQVKGRLRAPHREAGMEPCPSELRSWCLHPPVQVPSQVRRCTLRSVLEAA